MRPSRSAGSAPAVICTSIQRPVWPWTYSGQITAAWDAATHTLRLTTTNPYGDEQPGQWLEVLERLYWHTSEVTPGRARRTIETRIFDGTTIGRTLTYVNVSWPAQTPVLQLPTRTLPTWVQGPNGAPTAPIAVAPDPAISDRDSTHFTHADVVIAVGRDGDLLEATPGAGTGDITASWDPAARRLRLSSPQTATAAEFEAALRAVTFTDTAGRPREERRYFSITVSDGGRTSAVVQSWLDVQRTAQPPVLDLRASTVTWTQGDNEAGEPVALAPELTLGDLDNDGLAGAQVRVVDPAPGDRLSVELDAATGGIVALGTTDDTLLSLSGPATLAQWQTALRSVRFTAGEAPLTTTARTVRFETRDGDGTGVTGPETDQAITVAVRATPQTPLLSGAGGTVAFTEGRDVDSTPVAVAPALEVRDRDSERLQAALRGVTYTSLSDDPGKQDRTVEVTVTDPEARTSAAATVRVSVRAVADTPPFVAVPEAPAPGVAAPQPVPGPAPGALPAAPVPAVRADPRRSATVRGGATMLACKVAVAEKVRCTVELFEARRSRKGKVSLGRKFASGVATRKAGRKGDLKVRVKLTARGRALLRTQGRGLQVRVRASARVGDGPRVVSPHRALTLRGR